MVGGAAAVVVACFLAVVLFPRGELADRVLVMAVACGVVAAWVSQWRVRGALASAKPVGWCEVRREVWSAIG